MHRLNLTVHTNLLRFVRKRCWVNPFAIAAAEFKNLLEPDGYHKLAITSRLLTMYTALMYIRVVKVIVSWRNSCLFSETRRVRIANH